ncbi:CinA family protein [Erythrobacter sp.]|uniref:CinA family protein n=1 Tax=Erythrobacter sp. TaxID=1042 RepID=UPI0025CDE2DA|nr:nicotinamide-nucleotide amidohydrolase family protein [Erythrobacter sp.]
MAQTAGQDWAQCGVPDMAQLRASARSLLVQADRAGMTLATAESCTGGFLASLLTDIEGLSHCLDRGFVTYSKAAKHQMLGIGPDLIDRYGAVSEPVARAMAENSLSRAGCDLSLAITGLAGTPDLDEPEGPGVVYVGAAVPSQSWVYRVDYGERPRSEVRNLAAFAALAIGIRTVAGRTAD